MLVFMNYLIVKSYAGILEVAVAGDTLCSAGLHRPSAVGNTLTGHSVVSPAVTFSTLPVA